MNYNFNNIEMSSKRIYKPAEVAHPIYTFDGGGRIEVPIEYINAIAGRVFTDNPYARLLRTRPR